MVCIFRAPEVSLLFYTGGNGSVGTASWIATASQACGYELSLIIPNGLDCRPRRLPGIPSRMAKAVGE